MTSGWFRFLVPREWSGEQALAVVRVLQRAIDAIWSVHGEDIAAELGARGRRHAAWEQVLRQEQDDGDEEDIPF